jgi:hypothetical protein
MERKEALQYITAKLNEGIPKQVIYRELLSKIASKEDLLSYISEVPDAETRSRVISQNRILVGLLVFLLVINALYAVVIVIKAKAENIPWLILGGWAYILVPFFLMLVIKELKEYRRNGYRFIILLTIGVINVHLMGNSSLFDWLLIVGPWLPASVLALKIMKETHPYDRLFKSLDRDRLEADLTRAGTA